MVTRVPMGPVVAVKELMEGGGEKINPAIDADPPGVVKLTEPEEPVPTIATIEVEEITVNDVTGVPPKVMVEVPKKLVPVILMTAPAPAIAGENNVMVGAGMKVNPLSDAEPPGVVKLTAPEEPLPTMAIMEVEETTVNVLTGVPPNVIAEVFSKFVPVIFMSVPAAAMVGVNEVIVGAGMKVNPASDAVPPGVVKLTAPEEPLPTTAMIDVEETTVNELTGVPPNVITEVFSKFVPVMLMSVPVAATVGVKEVIVGGGGKYIYTQEAPELELSP
jgi:hypothetical protein